MKITVPIASRGRPAGLLAALTTLDALSTGNNEITYAVIVDTDDLLTSSCLGDWEDRQMLPKGTVIHLGPRSNTLNSRVNDVIAQHPADAYSSAVDDLFPLTQHWDAVYVAAKELPAYCWREMNDPGNATLLVISERWRKATGRYYPEYFPFWFADTWIAEVFMLAFGKLIPVIEGLSQGGKRGTTQGMRDLAFWFKFFAATRIERIEEAKRVCEAFGEKYVFRPEWLAKMENGDAFQLKKVPQFEAAFRANQGQPSDVYLQAKESAFKWLHDNTGALACS